MIKKLHLEIVRLVLGLGADLAMALVVEGLTLLLESLERDDDDVDEPAAADLLSYLQQIFMAGAQVRFDPELARPWSLLLGPQEISSATSLVDLVLQARAHAHGGSR